MKIHINFTVSTLSNVSFGMVAGDIELPEMPMTGDLVHFLRPDMPQIGFLGVLTAQGRSFRVQDDVPLAVNLGFLKVNSEEDAKVLMDYFEEKFNLVAFVY